MPGLLDKTETPPFSLMGLLTGGRTYASGWFQNRDRMQQIDMARVNEQARDKAFRSGVLQSPELKALNANPYDRMAQWNFWGKGFGGAPENLVPMGNQVLASGLSAIEQRKQSEISAAQSAANIRLSADESLRVDQIRGQRELQQKQDFLKLMMTPDQTGMTPKQAQMTRDFFGQQAGLKPPEGYSIAEGGNGFEPTIGGAIHQKMMDEGNAMSNMVNSAEYLQYALQTGQQRPGEFAAVWADMLMNMKQAATLGTLDEATLQFFSKIVPEYGRFGIGTEIGQQLSDKLGTDIKIWKSKLGQIGEKYSVPIETFGKNQPFNLKNLPAPPPRGTWKQGGALPPPPDKYSPDQPWLGSPGGGYGGMGGQ